jgi:hypothetical protein
MLFIRRWAFKNLLTICGGVNHQRNKLLEFYRNPLAVVIVQYQFLICRILIGNKQSGSYSAAQQLPPENSGAFFSVRKFSFKLFL